MVTLFLANVLGWYLVIIGLFLLLRHDYVRTIMSEVITQRALFFVVAIFTIILGLLMVISHNIWVAGWPVIITLIAWLALISGLIRLFAPDLALGWGQSMVKHPAGIRITALITLLIGLFLLFNAYYPYFNNLG